MKGHIIDVEANAAHVLVGQHTLLGRPRETTDNRVLDLIQVLQVSNRQSKNRNST